MLPGLPPWREPEPSEEEFDVSDERMIDPFEAPAGPELEPVPINPAWSAVPRDCQDEVIAFLEKEIASLAKFITSVPEPDIGTDQRWRRRLAARVAARDLLLRSR